MSRIRNICCFAALFSLLAVVQTFALVGIGVHYGFDNTLSMKNTTGLGDHITFDSLKLDPGTGQILNGVDIPAYVSRTNFKSDFSVGGKIYVDVIPVIDALEVSCDFGVWDYVGKINYPSSLKSPLVNSGRLADTANFNYTSEELTLNNFGLGYMGLKNTPYAKLNVDLTVRKYIVQFPPVIKTFKLYGGAGATVNFATPMLSANLVQDVINESVKGPYDLSGGANSLGGGLLGNNAIMKGVVNKIISGLTQPSYGAHIDLGVMVKIPVVPIGVYVDGKFMIPFGKLDKYVDIGGTGLLFNTGIALAF
jgi:hypothetical protein